MENKRTFSKEEISKILSKASKIQAGKDLYGDQQGLTEEELLHIAEEVGFDKDSLREAIQTSDLPELDSGFNWITASHKIQDVHIAPGELDENTWEEIVLEIRRVTGGIGKINKVGKSFEWEQRRREIGYTHISLTPQEGNTKIQFVSNWRGLMITSSFLSFIAGATITGIFLDGTSYPDIVYFLLPLLGGFGALSVGRFYLRSYFEKQKTQFKEIIKSVGKRLGRSAEPDIILKDRDTTGEESSSDSSGARRERS